jgi:tRNA (adenine22-N1)-methyltransferase
LKYLIALGGGKIADIGTDHAYTLIAACDVGVLERGFACDISKGSLLKAEQNIRLFNMEDKIETRLGNGLEVLQRGEADIIVISGMGGKLIGEILFNGAEIAASARHVILQPQRNVREMRMALHYYGYIITDEEIVQEKRKFYNIIICSKGREICYSDLEYEFGKILLKRKDYVLQRLLMKKLKLYEEIQIKTNSSLADKIKKIKEGLKCL